jgi:hypothetical protein
MASFSSTLPLATIATSAPEPNTCPGRVDLAADDAADHDVAAREDVDHRAGALRAAAHVETRAGRDGAGIDLDRTAAVAAGRVDRAGDAERALRHETDDAAAAQAAAGDVDAAVHADRDRAAAHLDDAAVGLRRRGRVEQSLDDDVAAGLEPDAAGEVGVAHRVGDVDARVAVELDAAGGRDRDAPRRGRPAASSPSAGGSWP